VRYLNTNNLAPRPSLTDFEQSVVSALLAGDHPTLFSLRSQIPFISVVNREETGCGIFTTFDVGHVASTSKDSITLSDLHIEMPSVEHGAAAILYIVEGRIHMLECVTYEGPWPKLPVFTELKYLQSIGLPTLSRDPQYIASCLTRSS
jgi:hypothetical protein